MTDSSGWCVYEDISTNHKSANRIELSQLGKIYLITSDLT